MDTESSLYELMKQLTTLQCLRNSQQQAIKVKSKLELRDIIRESFKTFNDVVAIPPSFCDNLLENKGTKEPHLEIARKNGPYLQHLKEEIDELFEAEQMSIKEAKFPNNLEEGVDGLKIEIQERKEQLKLYTCMMNNLDIILETNFYNQISMEDQIPKKTECDSDE